MILPDTDVMIDILRKYPPAMKWFDALDGNEEIVLPGYVLMELIQGCGNKGEQEQLQRSVEPYGVIWLSPNHCNRALDAFTRTRGRSSDYKLCFDFSFDSVSACQEKPA